MHDDARGEDAVREDAIREDAAREGCGVFGVLGVPAAARLTYLGLHALQHRGQESSGMVVGDGHRWQRHAGMGLVD